MTTITTIPTPITPIVAPTPTIRATPQVTKNALTRIFNSEPNFKPTLMVVSIQPPKNAQQQTSVMIGDGTRYTGAILSPLILKGLKRNSVITLNHYFWTTTNERNVVVILDMTVHQDDLLTNPEQNGSIKANPNRDPLRPGMSRRAKSASTKHVSGLQGQEAIEVFKEQAFKKSNSNESLSRKRAHSSDSLTKKKAVSIFDLNDGAETERTANQEKVSNLFSIATSSMESDIQKINSMYEKKKDGHNLRRTKSAGLYQPVAFADEGTEFHQKVEPNTEPPTIKRTVSVDGGPKFKRVSSRNYLVALPAIAEKRPNSFRDITQPRTEELKKSKSQNDLKKRGANGGNDGDNGGNSADNNSNNSNNSNNPVTSNQNASSSSSSSNHVDNNNNKQPEQPQQPEQIKQQTEQTEEQPQLTKATSENNETTQKTTPQRKKSFGRFRSHSLSSLRTTKKKLFSLFFKGEKSKK